MMTVGQLKAKLADIDDSLPVLVDATDIKLGNMGMNPGTFNVSDAKIGPADFGQAAVISASVN